MFFLNERMGNKIAVHNFKFFVGVHLDDPSECEHEIDSKAQIQTFWAMLLYDLSGTLFDVLKLGQRGIGVEENTGFNYPERLGQKGCEDACLGTGQEGGMHCIVI